MARKRIFLSIDTIPTQDASARAEIARRIVPPGSMSKPETIKAWERETKPDLVEAAVFKTAFDGALGRVVGIGFAIDDVREPSREHWFFNREDCCRDEEFDEFERQLLADALFEIDAKLEGFTAYPQIVAHNAPAVLRFLAQRAIVLGVRLPSWWPRDLRPWGPDLLDTMTARAGVGGHVSFEALCRTLGVVGNGEIEAHQVYDAWKAGDVQALDKRVHLTVDRLRRVATRMLTVYGQAAYAALALSDRRRPRARP